MIANEPKCYYLINTSSGLFFSINSLSNVRFDDMLTDDLHILQNKYFKAHLNKVKIKLQYEVCCMKAGVLYLFEISIKRLKFCANIFVQAEAFSYSIIHVVGLARYYSIFLLLFPPRA